MATYIISRVKLTSSDSNRLFVLLVLNDTPSQISHFVSNGDTPSQLRHLVPNCDTPSQIAHFVPNSQWIMESYKKCPCHVLTAI